jgi:transcriptional regulator with XRE-family HTH domain
MTTLMVVDSATPGEQRRKAVARRFRAELAQIGINGSEAAVICGVSQAWMSRRMNGAVPFNVDELDMVCRKLHIFYEYVASGIWPTGPDGSLLPRLESNQQPFGDYLDLVLPAAAGL